jgi:hypothetical protein
MHDLWTCSWFQKREPRSCQRRSRFILYFRGVHTFSLLCTSTTCWMMTTAMLLYMADYPSLNVLKTVPWPLKDAAACCLMVERSAVASRADESTQSGPCIWTKCSCVCPGEKSGKLHDYNSQRSTVPYTTLRYYVGAPSTSALKLAVNGISLPRKSPALKPHLTIFFRTV